MKSQFVDQLAKDTKNFRWWERGIIYQIYPRSFKDSNGDGIGDLRGIQSKLDYLEWLGVDAIWISPIFPSPMADFGYDVSNYTDIDSIFGTLADFDVLLADVHARGMKLLLDYVPQSYFGSTSVVYRRTFIARKRQTRLVHLVRPCTERRSAEQLAR